MMRKILKHKLLRMCISHWIMIWKSFLLLIKLIFYFQAEDGIRDGHVTGVKTCALPICVRRGRVLTAHTRSAHRRSGRRSRRRRRSEERRAGEVGAQRLASEYLGEENDLEIIRGIKKMY